jgi:hypothetical protein
MPLTEDLVDTCQASLERALCSDLGNMLAQRGFGPAECHLLVEGVDESPASHAPISQLKTSIEKDAPELVSDCRLERFLLLNSARRIADEISGSPLAESVKRLYADEFAFFASPGSEFLSMFQVGQYRFAEMCKIASLRRFPAGQMHWEISGVVRSSLRHVSPFALPKLFDFLARRLKGYRPCFRGHLNGRRKNTLLLLESEQNLAYYRMTKSMELQPDILGYVATSWIHSPATLKASPHLKWLNSVFLENGGLIVDMGVESPDCGVFVGDVHRRKLWERGEFKPRSAMVIWPRREMLDWAARHPELEEESVKQGFANGAKQQTPKYSESLSVEAQAMIGFLRSRILRNSNLFLDVDTPLISSGLVDSFAVLEVLQELETVTNRKISPADVSPADLDTVDKMLRTAERFSSRR